MVLIIIGLVLWLLQLLSWVGTWIKFEHGSSSIFGGFGAGLYGNLYLISVLIGSSLAAILGTILIIVGVALINKKHKKKELLHLSQSVYFSYPGEEYGLLQNRQANKKTPLLIATMVFAIYFIYRIYMNYRYLINAISEYKNDGYWQGFPTPDINEQFMIVLLEMLMILTLFISSVLLYRSKPFNAIRNYLLISAISGILSIFLIELMVEIPFTIRIVKHFGFEVWTIESIISPLQQIPFLSVGVCAFIYAFRCWLSSVFSAKSNQLSGNSALSDKAKMRSYKVFATVLFGLAIIQTTFNLYETMRYSGGRYFPVFLIESILSVLYPAILLITTLYLLHTKKHSKINVLIRATLLVFIMNLLYVLFANVIVQVLRHSFTFSDLLNFIPYREIFWLSVYILVYYFPHKKYIPVMQTPAISYAKPYQESYQPGFCSNCAAALSVGAAFCENCGAAIQQQYCAYNANTVDSFYPGQSHEPRY